MLVWKDPFFYQRMQEKKRKEKKKEKTPLVVMTQLVRLREGVT